MRSELELGKNSKSDKNNYRPQSLLYSQRLSGVHNPRLKLWCAEYHVDPSFLHFFY